MISKYTSFLIDSLSLEGELNIPNESITTNLWGYEKAISVIKK